MAESIPLPPDTEARLAMLEKLHSQSETPSDEAGQADQKAEYSTAGPSCNASTGS